MFTTTDILSPIIQDDDSSFTPSNRSLYLHSSSNSNTISILRSYCTPYFSLRTIKQSMAVYFIHPAIEHRWLGGDDDWLAFIKEEGWLV